MDKGIYCLILKNPSCKVSIGALGVCHFAGGWHCYVGSAQGPGGLLRLERHLRLAERKDKTPKWHIDYLLTDSRFTLVFALSAPTMEALECKFAAAIGDPGVPGFGCSDCTCRTHLFYRSHDPREEIETAFGRIGLFSGIKTIINPNVQGNV